MSHASLAAKIAQPADQWHIVPDSNGARMFVHIDSLTLLLDADEAVVLARKLQSVAAEILIANDHDTGPEAA